MTGARKEKKEKTSLQLLMKEELYVLGPLELAPNNFAVGITSYEAIKGAMPKYNVIRYRLHTAGDHEAAEAIGSCEKRADAAEEALEREYNRRKSGETRIKSLEEHAAKLEKIETEFKIVEEKLAKLAKAKGGGK